MIADSKESRGSREAAEKVAGNHKKMAAQRAADAAPVSCRESEVEREKRYEECVCECFTWLRMNGKLFG